MKLAITLLLLALATIPTEGKKRSKQNEVTGVESGMNEDKEEERLRQPFGFTIGNPFGLALQIPIISPDVFGNLQNQMKRLRQAVFAGGAMPAGKEGQLLDAEVKKLKLKTRTKSSNSTHGPFKTYTIERETVSTENKTNPKVLSKSVQSITTLDKKFKGKIPQEEKDKLGKMLFKFGPMQLRLNEIEEKPRCTSNKKCGKHSYCDAISSQCRKHLAPGSLCTQDGQCESKNGRPHRCTWGRCIVNTKPGSAGTFCKDESSCRPDSRDKEMCCQPQPDISHFAKVCIPKLSEGATCGRASIFDVFRHSGDEQCGVCKAGLDCRRIGGSCWSRLETSCSDLCQERRACANHSILFTGRKICVQNSVAKSFDNARKRSNIARANSMDKMDSMNQMDQTNSMDQMED